MSRRPRVLVVTGDVLTAKMAGAAIRAWHIAHHLASSHEVVLATTSGICTRRSESVRLEAPSRDAFEGLEAWCDVVIVQGYVLEHVAQLRESEKLMIIDLYTPLHLEALALSQDNELPARQAQNGLILAELNRQLVRGDFFICANERQRDLWLGQLSALGRVNPLNWDLDPTLRALIDTVPFGLDDADPVVTAPALRGVVPGIEAGDDLVIWGGGVYNWFDPLTLVRAIDIVRTVRPRVRLYFLGLSHPNPEVPAMAMATATTDLAAELGLTGRHIFFNDGWVDYAERQNYLMEADLAVTVHPVNAETTFSFRTRVLDYLWAGLPVVTTNGDAFADLVAQEDLGAVVPSGDPVALAGAIGHLLDDAAARAAARMRVAQVRERYRWEVVLGPLVSYCDRPSRAPDRLPPAPVGPGRPEHRTPTSVLVAALRDGGVRSTAVRINGRLTRWAQGRWARGRSRLGSGPPRP